MLLLQGLNCYLWLLWLLYVIGRLFLFLGLGLGWDVGIGTDFYEAAPSRIGSRTSLLDGVTIFCNWS